MSKSNLWIVLCWFAADGFPFDSLSHATFGQAAFQVASLVWQADNKTGRHAEVLCLKFGEDEDLLGFNHFWVFDVGKTMS